MSVQCAGQFTIKRASFRRAATPFAKSGNFDDAHRAVEGNRHNVPHAHLLARTIYALAVEPHVSGFDQRRRVAARAHHARVPQPFVDALAAGVQILAALLVLLELLLEGCELGEGRIRIGFFIAPIASVRTRVILLALGAVRTFVAAAARTAGAAVIALPALRTGILPLHALLAIVPVPAILAIAPLGTVAPLRSL